jgi:ATP-binding cassette subfamily G (WHITE) protein 2 (SNQ2)
MGLPIPTPGGYVPYLFPRSYVDHWHSKNFGIIIVFAVGFITALLIFTEFNTSMANDTSVTLFKRGSKRAVPVQTTDEESNQKEKIQPDEQHIEPETEKEKPSALPAKMTDIFSWQHVNYTVPIQGGEDRQLLSDVSGFVAPGKLTALMGESGAGKTTLLNVLAQRVSTGVVSGDRFVNGQALPADFQSQT